MTDWKLDLSRRLFLRTALAGTGLALLGPLASSSTHTAWAQPGARSKRRKRLTVIYLYGGNDGVNTVVPVSLGNYADRRGALALDTGRLHSLDDGPTATKAYALHYALPQLAQVWAEGNLAVVQKVGYPIPNMSHFVSQDIWSFGVRGEFAPLHISPSGWIARYADQFAPTPTGAISLGSKVPKDMQGGATNRFHALTLESFNLDPGYPRRHDESEPQNLIEPDNPQRMRRILQVMEAVQREGLQRNVHEAMAGATDMLEVVHQSLATYDNPVVYPSEEPGICLRDIAILCNAGFDTRIFFTGYSDFDHHSAQEERHAELLHRLDQGLGAFIADLKRMDLWQDMVVAVVSEFGRRNYVNGSKGTDHGHGNVVLLLGGNVKGGLYGTNLTTADLAGESLPVEIDFRSIYKELLTRHLDADPAKVFPEPQKMNTVLNLLSA